MKRPDEDAPAVPEVPRAPANGGGTKTLRTVVWILSVLVAAFVSGISVYGWAQNEIKIEVAAYTPKILFDAHTESQKEFERGLVDRLQRIEDKVDRLAEAKH